MATCLFPRYNKMCAKKRPNCFDWVSEEHWPFHLIRTFVPKKEKYKTMNEILQRNSNFAFPERTISACIKWKAHPPSVAQWTNSHNDNRSFPWRQKQPILDCHAYCHGCPWWGAGLVRNPFKPTNQQRVSAKLSQLCAFVHCGYPRRPRCSL